MTRGWSSVRPSLRSRRPRSGGSRSDPGEPAPRTTSSRRGSFRRRCKSWGSCWTSPRRAGRLCRTDWVGQTRRAAGSPRPPRGQRPDGTTGSRCCPRDRAPLEAEVIAGPQVVQRNRRAGRRHGPRRQDEGHPEEEAHLLRLDGCWRPRDYLIHPTNGSGWERWGPNSSCGTQYTFSGPSPNGSDRV